MFILNKYLVKDTGTTAHQNNYHKAYNNPICQFGEAVLADTRYLVNYKLRQRNLEQKIKGIWIGKDPTTDEHLIAWFYLQVQRHHETTQTEHVGHYIPSYHTLATYGEHGLH